MFSVGILEIQRWIEIRSDSSGVPYKSTDLYYICAYKFNWLSTHARKGRFDRFWMTTLDCTLEACIGVHEEETFYGTWDSERSDRVCIESGGKIWIEITDGCMDKYGQVVLFLVDSAGHRWLQKCYKVMPSWISFLVFHSSSSWGFVGRESLVG